MMRCVPVVLSVAAAADDISTLTDASGRVGKSDNEDVIAPAPTKAPIAPAPAKGAPQSMPTSVKGEPNMNCYDKKTYAYLADEGYMSMEDQAAVMWFDKDGNNQHYGTCGGNNATEATGLYFINYRGFDGLEGALNAGAPAASAETFFPADKSHNNLCVFGYTLDKPALFKKVPQKYDEVKDMIKSGECKEHDELNGVKKVWCKLTTELLCTKSGDAPPAPPSNSTTTTTKATTCTTRAPTTTASTSSCQTEEPSTGGDDPSSSTEDDTTTSSHTTSSRTTSTPQTIPSGDAATLGLAAVAAIVFTA